MTHVVEHGDVLGDMDRVSVGDGNPALAEAKGGGLASEVGAGEDGVGRGGGDPAVPEEVMFGDPDGGEAGLFVEAGLGAPFLDPGVTFDPAAVDVESAIESHAGTPLRGWGLGRVSR